MTLKMGKRRNDDADENDDFASITLQKKVKIDDGDGTLLDSDQDSLDDILPPTRNAYLEPTMMMMSLSNCMDSLKDEVPSTTRGLLTDETCDKNIVNKDVQQQQEENKEFDSVFMDLDTQAIRVPSTKPETHFAELETNVLQTQTLSSRLVSNCLETLPETKPVELPETCPLYLESPPAKEEKNGREGAESPAITTLGCEPTEKKPDKKVKFADSETAVEKYEKIRETMTQQVFSSMRETIQPSSLDDQPQVDFKQAAIHYRIQCAVLRQKIKILSEGGKL